jgi:hypothetical protein
VDAIGPHIPFSWLADLAEGRLSADQQAETNLHLASCPRCAASLSWLRHTIGLMRDDAAENAPAAAIAAAKRLFRPAPPARRQVAANLRFDSAHMPAAVGMRAGVATERQLLFTAAEYTIDLRVAPRGEHWAVSGQLLGATAGEKVELRGSGWMSSAPLNEQSEFVLPLAPRGSYTLNVQLADFDISIGDLELGA